MDNKQIALIGVANLLLGYGIGKYFQSKGNQSSDNIKTNVRSSYRKVAAKTKEQNFGVACCGEGEVCGPSKDTQTVCGEVMCESYETIEGYMKEADLVQGCGIPTKFADIKKGDVVLDLGSGAGIDCFVAREITGPEGKVIGLDFTEEMIRKAQNNSDQKGYRNVEFRFGDIEDMPLIDNYVDVILSNCVINLCPDKRQAYKEILRVLKHGGHFSISDIVIDGHLPKKLKEAAEVYSACIGGALNLNDQLQLVKDLGFVNVEIKKQKVIGIPDDLYLKYISKKELEDLKKSNTQILSITLYAEKPQKTSCC